MIKPSEPKKPRVPWRGSRVFLGVSPRCRRWRRRTSVNRTRDDDAIWCESGLDTGPSLPGWTETKNIMTFDDLSL